MAKRYTEYSIEGQLTITDGLNPYTLPASAGVVGEVLTMGPGAGEVSWLPGGGGGSQDLQSVMDVGSTATVAPDIEIETAGLMNLWGSSIVLGEPGIGVTSTINIDAVSLHVGSTGNTTNTWVQADSNLRLEASYIEIKDMGNGIDITSGPLLNLISSAPNGIVNVEAQDGEVIIESTMTLPGPSSAKITLGADIQFEGTGLGTPSIGDALVAKDVNGNLQWASLEICGIPVACTSPGPIDGDTLVYNNSSGFWELVPTTGTDTNIANTDLTLDANRTTDLDAFTLGFISGSVAADPKVGIGTASPTGTLELSTQSISNNVTFELSELGTTRWYIETDFLTANKQVNFKAGTYNFMTFEVAGTGSDRIGMGTTTPNSNVHISGNGTISSYTDETSLEITNSTGATPGNIDNVAALRFSQAGTSIPSGLIVSGREGDYTAGNEDGYLAFSVSKSTVLTEWLHIDSDGDTTFSTWKIVGNDLMPMNEPANIGSPGSPSNRVNNIYMDSVIDYATDLKFEENGTDRIILNSGGDIELGIDGASTAIKIVSTDGEIAVGNVSTLTNPLAAIHIFSHGSGTGKSLYILNDISADVLTIEDGGRIIFGNLTDSYTFPTARAGVGEVLTDVLGNGVLSWQTAGGGAINTIYTANDALTGDRVVNCANFQMNFNNTQGMQITGDGSPLNDTIHDIRNNGGQSIIAVSESNKSVLVNGGLSTGLTYDASTVFQIDSTSQGFLVPRMTTGERDLINSGTFATGLTVYNLTTNTLQYYDSTSWIDAGGGSQDLQSVMNIGSTATGLITAIDLNTSSSVDITGQSVGITSSVGNITIPSMANLNLQAGGGGAGDITVGGVNMGTPALGDVLTAFSAGGELRWTAPTGYGIYKGSGSLSVASTVVTMGANDIQFSGTTGIFKLGVSDLWYDSSSGKIGMGMIPAGTDTLSVFQNTGAGTSENGIFGVSQGAHIGINTGIRGDGNSSTLVNIGIAGNAGGTSGVGLVTAKNIGVRAYSTGTLADNYGIYALTGATNPGNDNIAGYFEATNLGLGGSAFAIKTLGNINVTQGDIVLEQSGGVAGRLHFEMPIAPGDTTTFRAQVQSSQIDYILPADKATAANDVLTNNGSPGDQTLSWKSPSNLLIRSIALASSTFTTRDYTINCTGALPSTINLPTAVGIIGKMYVLKNSGLGTVTLAAAVGEFIDGAPTVTLAVQYESITVQSDGADWIVI